MRCAFMRVVFIALPFTFLYAMVQALMRGVGEVKAPLYIVGGHGRDELRSRSRADLRQVRRSGMGVDGGGDRNPDRAGDRGGDRGLALLFGGRYGIHIRLAAIRAGFRVREARLPAGYPASIEQSARGLGMTVITFLIVGFGTVVTASYGVGANVFNVVIIPAMGFSMATSTLVGQNIGAGNIARAEKVARLAGGHHLLGADGRRGDLLHLSARIVRFFVPRRSRRHPRRRALHPHRGVELRLHRPAIRPDGRVARSGEMIPAMVISLVSQWVLQFPLAYVLSKHTSLHADGVWWSIPIANVATA